MMHLIKNEVRIPLTAVFFFSIGASLLYRDKLGMPTVVCFSLASLCLFCAFVIMPSLLKNKYTSLENEEYDPLDDWTVQDAKTWAFAQYRSNRETVILIAVFLAVLGIVFFAMLH
jgi:hypothetical protein